MKRHSESREPTLLWTEIGYKLHFYQLRAKKFTTNVIAACPKLNGDDDNKQLTQWVMQLFSDKNINENSVRELLDNIELVLASQQITQEETANQIRGICAEFRCNNRRTFKSAGMSTASMLAIAGISYVVIAAACPPLAAAIAVAALTALATLTVMRQWVKHGDAKQRQLVRQHGEEIAEAIENPTDIQCLPCKVDVEPHGRFCIFCTPGKISEKLHQKFDAHHQKHAQA